MSGTRLPEGMIEPMLLKRLLKFLHTVGAIGFMGAMACLLAFLAFAPEPASLAEYAAMRRAIAGVGTWVYLPSLMLTLIAGLLSIAATPAFHNAGWAWIKLLTGILVFEWGFVAVQGGIEREAGWSARVLANQADAALLGATLAAERNSLWILLAVSAVNIVLGIWRPKLG